MCQFMGHSEPTLGSINMVSPRSIEMNKKTGVVDRHAIECISIVVFGIWDFLIYGAWVGLVEKEKKRRTS